MPRSAFFVERRVSRETRETRTERGYSPVPNLERPLRGLI